MPSEPPPPLPSMPPPAPNWNTFPTATGELASTDDDFFDQNDLLPDLGTEASTEEEKTMSRDRKEAPAAPETGCVRTDILRRKSQFLGLEKSEEYHTLQTGLFPWLCIVCFVVMVTGSSLAFILLKFKSVHGVRFLAIQFYKCFA